MNYQSTRNQLSINKNKFMVFNPYDEHKQLAVDDHKFLIEVDRSFLNESSASISVVRDDFFFAQTIQRTSK
ncbi:hypothetical protein ACFOUV_18530 [Oceanobacillus longus]|uniref:Uncharacterized protein n=1 Tax=Oceanobacillus longus TaxID=930120 RepID=A0ABV8H3K9_9BACI